MYIGGEVTLTDFHIERNGFINLSPKDANNPFTTNNIVRNISAEERVVELSE